MQAGDVVADRFKLEELAGSGGMAAVFLATDVVSQQRVALKVAYGNPDAAHRYGLEAELLESISDDRVVRYVTHGTERGFFFLALEWLDGEDLGSRLDRAGLTIGESLTVVAQAAKACAVAHGHGLIHRDIKPSNLFLVDRRLDRVKLIDFGIAQAMGLQAKYTTQMVGTPMYMAPEQVTGERQLTPAVDIYALGCVLYECLTGAPPLNGDSLMELLTATIMTAPPPPSSHMNDIPPSVDAIAQQLLEKRPALRVGSAEELAERLLALRAELEDGQTRQVGPTRAAAPLMLEEQRLVTVLVAQPPAASRAPGGLTIRMDDLAPLLPDDRLTQIVSEHGARAERVGGVGVVIVPRSHGNPVARAARCALALREAQPELRLGMATRRAIMTDGWPFGEAIEHALQLAAKSDEHVLVDATTARMLDPQFVLRGDGSAAQMLVSYSSRPKSTLTMASTRLVGRTRELDMLRGAVDDVAASRTPQAVLIVGQAGMGKSRVAHEMMTRVRKEKRRALAIARADPIAAGSPYGLAAQTLRQLVGFDENEGRSRREAAVSKRCEELGIEEPEREAVCKGLEMLLDAAGDGARSLAATLHRDPRVVADAIRTAFSRWIAAEAARVEALVLFVEDLHWGDLPSVRLFDHALADLAGSPLLIVALARPEVIEAFPDLWRDRDVQSLRLRPLTAEEGSELVQAVVGEQAAPEVVRRLVARGEGNAYYLEELARAERDGRQGIPDSVLALAQARLDHLAPEARRVLRAASVFGDAFWIGGVLALLGEWHATELDGLLPQLVDEGIIVERSGSELDGATGYAFAHEILREAAYAALPVGDRRSAHMLAGTWLEQHREADAKALAEQWRRSAHPHRAVPWFERAARRALEGHDFATALACVDAAFECGAVELARGRLHVIAAEAHEWTSDEGQREQHALQALAELEPGTPHWFEGFIHALLSGARLKGMVAVTPLCAALENLPPERQRTTEEVIAMTRTAGQMFVIGHPDGGRALLEQAERAAESLPSIAPRLAAWLHWAIAWRALNEGDVLRAYQEDIASLRDFEIAKDARNMAYAQTNLGYEQLRLGLLEDAERSLTVSHATSVRLGLTAMAANALHNLSYVYALCGRFEEARRAARKAIADLEASGHPRSIATAYDYLARIELLAGDPEAADHANARALGLLASFEALQVLPRATRARILLELGKVEEALDTGGWAYRMMRRDGGQADGEEAYVCVSYAAAALAGGERDAARDAVRVAKQQIDEHAERLGDSPVRQAFLGIADHVRVLAWVEELS